MSRLDARVEKLESQIGANRPRVVVLFAEAGEASIDCIRSRRTSSGRSPASSDRESPRLNPGIALSRNYKPC